jgi:hypothetical protein
MEIKTHLATPNIPGWKEMADEMLVACPDHLKDPRQYKFRSENRSYEEVRSKIPLFDKFIQSRTKRRIDGFKFYLTPPQGMIPHHKDGSWIYDIPYYAFSWVWPLTHNPNAFTEFWETDDSNMIDEQNPKGESAAQGIYYEGTTTKATAYRPQLKPSRMNNLPRPNIFIEMPKDKTKLKMIGKTNIMTPTIIRVDHVHSVNNRSDSTRITVSIRWEKHNDFDIDNYIDLDGLL